jgi:hypothetical protein
MATLETNLPDILAQIKEKLLEDGVVNDSEVYLSISPVVQDFPPSDQFVMLTIGRQPVDQGIVTGGGDGAQLGFIGQVNVTLFTRLALDETPRADDMLTQSSLGAFAKQQCIIASLHLFFPEDDNGNFYLQEPMRLIEIQEPTKPKQGWCGLPSIWECQYIQAVSC